MTEWAKNMNGANLLFVWIFFIFLNSGEVRKKSFLLDLWFPKVKKVEMKVVQKKVGGDYKYQSHFLRVALKSLSVYKKLIYKSSFLDYFSVYYEIFCFEGSWDIYRRTKRFYEAWIMTIHIKFGGKFDSRHISIHLNVS